jgi:hypothetical protein
MRKKISLLASNHDQIVEITDKNPKISKGKNYAIA